MTSLQLRYSYYGSNFTHLSIHNLIALSICCYLPSMGFNLIASLHVSIEFMNKDGFFFIQLVLSKIFRDLNCYYDVTATVYRFQVRTS